MMLFCTVLCIFAHPDHR